MPNRSNSARKVAIDYEENYLTAISFVNMMCGAGVFHPHISY
jgi:hypothetical protein